MGTYIGFIAVLNIGLVLSLINWFPNRMCLLFLQVACGSQSGFQAYSQNKAAGFAYVARFLEYTLLKCVSHGVFLLSEYNKLLIFSLYGVLSSQLLNRNWKWGCLMVRHWSFHIGIHIVWVCGVMAVIQPYISVHLNI